MVGLGRPEDGWGFVGVVSWRQMGEVLAKGGTHACTWQMSPGLRSNEQVTARADAFWLSQGLLKPREPCSSAWCQAALGQAPDELADPVCGLWTPNPTRGSRLTCDDDGGENSLRCRRVPIPGSVRVLGWAGAAVWKASHGSSSAAAGAVHAPLPSANAAQPPSSGAGAEAALEADAAGACGTQSSSKGLRAGHAPAPGKG